MLEGNLQNVPVVLPSAFHQRWKAIALSLPTSTLCLSYHAISAKAKVAWQLKLRCKVHHSDRKTKGKEARRLSPLLPLSYCTLVLLLQADTRMVSGHWSPLHHHQLQTEDWAASFLLTHCVATEAEVRVAKGKQAQIYLICSSASLCISLYNAVTRQEQTLSRNCSCPKFCETSSEDPSSWAFLYIPIQPI